MKKILSLITAVTKTQTVKDALVVTVGMAFTTVFSALSIFLIARFLGPAQFGLYSAALAMVTIVADAFDLAIGSSIVNFSAQQNVNSAKFIKYGLYLKLVIGFTLGLIFYLLSPGLAKLIKPELLQPLQFAAIIIPAVFLLRFPRSILQAQKQFIKDTTLEITTSLVRLIFVGSFYYLLEFTVITALSAYFFGALSALLIGSTLISWHFLKTSVTPQVRKNFFHFQKWLTLGFILASFHSRIDAALLLRLSDANANGIYQAAYRFFMPAFQLASILSLVFAPRFASFNGLSQARNYLIKAFKLTAVLSLVVLLIIPLAPFLVRLVFGTAYLQAVLPTQILAVGFVFFLAGSPFVSYLIYSVKKTRAFFILSLSQLTLIIALDFLFIPQLQAIGAAIASSLTLIIINILTACLSLKFQSVSQSV